MQIHLKGHQIVRFCKVNAQMEKSSKTINNDAIDAKSMLEDVMQKTLTNHGQWTPKWSKINETVIKTGRTIYVKILVPPGFARGPRGQGTAYQQDRILSTQNQKQTNRRTAERVPLSKPNTPLGPLAPRACWETPLRRRTRLPPRQDSCFPWFFFSHWFSDTFFK